MNRITRHQAFLAGEMAPFAMSPLLHSLAGLKTDDRGAFEICTIRPGGYPRSTLPQHIHFEAEAPGFRPKGTELLFDDDPRLTSEQRQRATGEGFIISKASEGRNGEPVFRYEVTMKEE